MQDDINDITNQWKKAKHNLAPSHSVDSLIKVAEVKRRSTLAFQYGNMIVLMVVVTLLVLGFVYVFPFKEMISRIGIALMVGGLILRIVIEYFSTVKMKAINFSENAVISTDKTIAFYNFRKRVHGRVTVTIIAIYCLGLAMLTQEFMRHIGPIILLFDLMFCITGVAIVWQVRKGIRKEMEDLQEIIKIKSQLAE